MIKSLRILGVDYPVEFSDMMKVGGNGNAGCVDTSGCKIFVSNKVNSPQHQKSVLLHEIIEAINYRLELQLEHEKITQLESGLFSVFADNPELAKFLSEEGDND